MKYYFKLSSFVWVFLLYLISPVQAQSHPEIKPVMNPDNFGTLNPDAPPQQSIFDFLIGRLNCQVIVNQEDGSTSRLDAKAAISWLDLAPEELGGVKTRCNISSNFNPVNFII